MRTHSLSACILHFSLASAVRFLGQGGHTAPAYILAAVVTSGILAHFAQVRADEGGDQAKAEAVLQQFAERVKQRSGDRTRLRHEIINFRLEHPGTSLAAHAAALLAQLPSPLDNLKRANLPALEQFTWQPDELVAVIGEHRGRHGYAVSCVAYSPDGTSVASGGLHYLRLWDPATLRLQHLLGQHYVQSLAFSRDSKMLAVGGAYGVVTVWDVEKGKEPRIHGSVQACSSTVYNVAFSPDNKSVAAACFDNAVRVYHVTGPKMEEEATLNAHTKPVTAVAYSPDGKTLVSGSQDLTLRVWDVQGRDTREHALLEGHAAPITAVAYSPRGSLLASAGADGELLLWNMPAATRSRPRVALAPKAGVLAALMFSSSGTTLAGAGSDGTARLWTVTGTPRERAKLEGHAGAVQGVAFAPDGRTLVTGGIDWTVRSWDLQGAKPKERFTPWSHLSHVHGIDFSLDLETLVSGSEDRVIRLWDLTKPDLKTRNYLKGDLGRVFAVAYSPDGKFVAAGGENATVRQWDAHTGRNKATLMPNPTYVYQLAYSPDSRQLLARGQKNVILWDALNGGEVRRFGIEDISVNCAAFSPDGRFVLTGHGIRLYKDGKPVYKDNTPVYTDCMLRLFDARSGDEVFSNKSFTLPVYSVGFSVDGRRAFSGLYEPALRRWDVTPPSLTPVEGWKGATGYVHGLLCSPDGRHLVTRGLDGQVVLWDLATGKRLRQWSIPEVIGHMAYASDSRHLAIALGTGVVYILRLPPPTLESK
jgi:WD40 repeat protein